MIKINSINSTTYEVELKGGDKVEIGDKSISKFKPHIKLNRWDGECFIKCFILDNGHSSLAVEGDKVKWVNSKIESHFVASEKGESFVWDIVLKEKPKTNIFNWNIETQGLKFYYQSPLNQQKQEEGLICTETECKDKDGNVVIHRPENVVGSYAVYHATRTNMHASKADAEKYKCGKAFHIYRPKVTDAKGKEIWGVLNINQAKGIMTVTVDQDWLDNAVYPVVIDPIFGYYNEGVKGGTTKTISSYVYGSIFQITENGTGDSITWYIWYDRIGTETSNLKVAIYDSSLALEASGAGVIGDDYDNWLTIDLSTTPSLIATSSYWLTGRADEYLQTVYCYYDAGTTNQGSHDTTIYADFPEDLYTPAGYNDRKYSVYCTYTVGEPPAGMAGAMTTNTGYWGW